MTEILVGFLIAAGVGMTGVGAGSLLAPVLMLFFNVPPAAAVGTALAFSAVIKLTIAPVYIVRKQIHYPTLLRLCCGGVPGVLLGFYAMDLLDAKHHRNVLFLGIGVLVASMALYNLIRTLHRSAHHRAMRDRSNWLPLIALGIGTDVMFGLACSLIGGSFHLSAGHFQSAILIHLIIGGMVGALIGASLLSVLPSRPLRVALSAWLTCMGVQLCWQAFA